MPKKPTLVVDIDGVLFDTPIDAVAIFNAGHGTRYAVTDIFDYDARHDKTKFAIDGVDYFHKHQHDTSAYHVVPGAKDALQRLHREMKVIALTSRNYDAFHDSTVAVIREHFAGLVGQVYFTTAPGQDNDREKGEIIKELGADILVDDAVRFCESAARHGVFAILLSQPYNLTGHNWPSNQTARDWIAGERLIEQHLQS
jgi:phosphoglycolate phosphatase-like HAD superfamily hydrolase